MRPTSPTYSGTAYLPRTLLAFFAAVTVTSCSLQAANTSESFPLAPTTLTQIPDCSAVAEQRNPTIYRCAGASAPMFVTVVKDCGVSEKFSHRATTRQLLVGITNLKVLNQEAVNLGSSKALRSVVEGTLDVDPILISTFTVRHDSCVTDLVVWQASLEKAPASLSENLAQETIARETQIAMFQTAATLLAQRVGIDGLGEDFATPPRGSRVPAGALPPQDVSAVTELPPSSTAELSAAQASLSSTIPVRQERGSNEG